MHPLCAEKYLSAVRLLKLKSLFDYIKGSKRVVKRQLYLLVIHRLVCVNVFTQCMSRSKTDES